MLVGNYKQRARITIVGFVSLFFLYSGTAFAQDSETTYIVKPGDSLGKIAKVVYGSVYCWPIIAAVPDNKQDYKGPLFIGKKLVIPPQSACDEILSPVHFSNNLTKIEQRTLAPVADQPWKSQGNLIQTYTEGVIRNPVEFPSIDILSYAAEGSIKRDHIREWLFTFEGGGWPIRSFCDTTKVCTAFDDLDRRYEQDIVDIAPSPAEKEVLTWWNRQVAPYVKQYTLNQRDGIEAKIRYKDNSHWGFRVAVPHIENGVARYQTDFGFFVIDGKETERYYHPYGLAITPAGHWAFRYQVPIQDGCDPWRYGNCMGPQYIKTNKEVFGPYDAATPPIPTVDGNFYYWVDEKGVMVLYKNGIPLDRSDWIDSLVYGKDGKNLLYRARKGEQWTVAINGIPGSMWDYVDMLESNPATGSYVYRARDIQGVWYIVKNGIPVKQDLEPRGVLFNRKTDEPLLIKSGDKYNGILELESIKGTWKYQKPVIPKAISPTGEILFASHDSVRVLIRDESGKTQSICSSSVCSHDESYWLNNVELGKTVFRMTPLFSKEDGRLVRSGFKYYGVPMSMAFDDKGRLVLYTIQDAVMKRTVYQVK